MAASVVFVVVPEEGEKVKRFIRLLGLPLALWFSAGANAALLTFDYTGVVTSVSGPGAAFGIVTAVGDPVSGLVTYDSTAVQTTSTESDPTVAVYLFDPPSLMSVTIGENPTLTRTIGNINIFDFDDRDFILIVGDGINAFEVLEFDFSGPATVFDTDSLQNVTDLDSTLGEYTIRARGLLQTENPNLPHVNQIIFDITSITFRSDSDGDGTIDSQDNCPSTANPAQTNTDGDALGDACDPDDDNDGVLDGADNCPLIANANQADNDSDGAGDACDRDDDNDGMPDAFERANRFDPLNPADASQDADGDGFTNLEEFNGRSDPHDPGSIPSPIRAMPWLELLLGD